MVLYVPTLSSRPSSSPTTKRNERIKQAAFLAPFSINFGLGMKYELEKQFTDKHKKIKFSTNLAPISYTYMYTTQEIDYSRHGFKKNEETGEFNNKLNQIGSTIRADLAFDFNRNVSWQSRLYFFTTYGDHTIGEVREYLGSGHQPLFLHTYLFSP